MSLTPKSLSLLDVLEQVDREVQGEGWHFNTEVAYPFTADVPLVSLLYLSTVLQLSDNKFANNQKYQTVLRDGKLYDKVNHTYTFPSQLHC